MPENAFYPSPGSATVSRIMRANRKADTRPELALRSALQRRGCRFRKALPIKGDGLTVVADVVFTRKRVAVFLDGCFWHSCPDHGTMPTRNGGYWLAKLRRNVDRDLLVTGSLRECGWTVVRIWEHTVWKDLDAAVDSVMSALEGRD